jgi:F0F1-type ATP synthase assembly protein I
MFLALFILSGVKVEYYDTYMVIMNLLVLIPKFPFVYSIFVPHEDGQKPKHVEVVIIKTISTIIVKTMSSYTNLIPELDYFIPLFMVYLLTLSTTQIVLHPMTI